MDDNKIRFKNIEASDVSAIYQLGLDCFSEERVEYLDWSEREVERFLHSYSDFCFVCYAGEKLLAFFLGEIYESKRVGFVSWVGIKSDTVSYLVRKRIVRESISHKMMAKFISLCKSMGILRVFSDIGENNNLSENFIKKLDFKLHSSVNFWCLDL